MNGNQLANKENLSLVHSNDNYQLSIQDIKKYINPKATESECFSFLRLCSAQGLNPFLREAYLVKYGTEDASFVVGKDVFLKRAETLSEYKGFVAGIIVKSKSGIDKPEGNFYIPEEQTLLGGWAEVYRSDRDKPIRIEVPLSEYVQTKKDGTTNRSWRKMPSTMIRKVALVQAFREAFPNEFGGMYDGAEMPVDYEKLPDEKITISDSSPQQNTNQQATKTDKKSKESALDMVELETQACRELHEEYPNNPDDMDEFLIQACKRFYSYMKDIHGYDIKLADRKAETLLGFEEGEIKTIREVLANPSLTRDLNVAIWNEDNEVLFPSFE